MTCLSFCFYGLPSASCVYIWVRPIPHTVCQCSNNSHFLHLGVGICDLDLPWAGRYWTQVYPPTCIHFDPLDVEHLVSLLESWALASPLTNFKLAGKNTTLSVVVMEKHYSDLTYD